MKLIILTAVLAVCGAAKLEKRFILPGSARIGGSGLTGGSAHIGGSVARPAPSAVGLFGRVLTNDVPSGGYTNDAQGVVVDAIAPGTRTSGVESTGLGGPRTAYGSVNSKVGEAAFEFGGAANKAPLFGLGAAGDGASRVGFGGGSAAVKGGNVGGLGTGVSPGAASISTDGSGFGSAALNAGNAGGLGIGLSSGAASISTDDSGLGSAAIKGGNAGSLGIGASPGGALISTDGFGLGSNAHKGGNAGSFVIGVSPGASSISTDGLGFGTAAVKGGNAGSFGIGISPGAGSISTNDSSGIASAAVKGGNAGSFGFGVSSGAGSISTDGSGLGSAALKEGTAGGLGIGTPSGAPSISTDSSGFGSAAIKGANVGGLGIGSTSGTDSIHTGHEDDKGYALKFANSFASKKDSLEKDSGISVGVKGVSDSAAVNDRNAGSLGVGVSPAVGTVSTDGSGFGSAAGEGVNAGSFGIGVSQGASSISTGGSGFGSTTPKEVNAGSFGIVSPGVSSVSTDGSEFGSAAVKGGNAGSLGFGVSPGAGSILTDGSKFGSTTVKGENVGGLGIGATPGIDFVHTGHEDDKTYALKFANSFGLKKYSYGFETDNGISVGAKGVSADGIKANGEYSYKGDDGKEYSVKYTADKNGYRPVGSHLPTPPPIPDEILESLKQNAKEEAAGIVDDGTYNAGKYKDEGDTSNNGETASIGGSLANQAIKSNAAIQSTGSVTGSVGIQGSYGHTQGFGGQIFDNKNIGFGSSQGEQEIVGQGLFGVKPQLGFQTTTSHESGFDKTERFGVQTNKNVIPNSSGSSASASASTSNKGLIGVPTLEGSFKGSSNDNSAYSSATVTSSGSASAFATTGNIDAASQPYLKLVDKRPKLPNQPSKDVSLSTSSAEVGTLGGSLKTNFPAQTSTNTVLNSATVGSSLSSATSSHNDDLTQASISSFPSLLPSLSSNFGKLSSSQSQQSKKVSQSANDQKLSVIGGAQSSIQQGTVYEYSKPTTSLSSEGHVISSQVNSETETSQTLFGSQDSLNKPSQTQYSEKTFGSSQSGSKLQQSGANSFQQNQGSIYEYNKPATSLTFSKDTKYSGVSQGTGSSFSQTQYGSTPESLFGQKQQTTGSLSQSSTAFGHKPVGDSQTSTTYEKNQFSSSYGSLPTQKPKNTLDSFVTSSGSSKGDSVQTVQFGVKPIGSPQTTGNSFSQTQLGSTSVSQSGQKPQTSTLAFGIKPVDVSQTSTTFEKTQFGSSSGTLFNEKPKSSQSSSFASNDASKGNAAHLTTLFGIKPFGSSQTVKSSSSQAHLGSSLGSTFDKKSQTTGTLSQTTTTFEQKPVGVSQTSSTFKKTQFSTLSSNGASEGQSGQSTQFSLKPFGSTLSTGSSFPQTQFGSTSTSSTSEKTQFGSLSSTGTSKGHYGSITQFGVKPFGSTLNTGSSFSQSMVGSTFGSQNDQKSQQGVGTISTTFPHVTPISQYGKQPFDVQPSFGSFQQSQHYSSTTGSKFVQQPQVTGTVFGQKPTGISQTNFDYKNNQFSSLSSPSLSVKPQSTLGSSFSTSSASKDASAQTGQFIVKPFGSSQSQLDISGSLFGKKQQTTGTLSQTSTTFGQKPVGISQTSATHDKNQFGSLPGTLFNEKSQTSQGGSFSSSDATKGQSGVTTQFGVKPFGSTLNTGSSFSQTQFSSTSESQKDHKSQLGVGTVSTTFPHVTPPISQYDKKPFGTQSTTFGSFQQTQHYAGQKPQTTGTLSQTSTTFGQKPVGISQTSATHDKTQFGSLTGTLFNEKSQTSHGASFSSSDATKGQSGVTTQFGVKPFGSTLNTGSSFSQTQFSSTSESQKDHKSQLGVGTVSTTFPHVTPPISQYDKKPFGTQSTTFGSFQQTQHYAGQKPQTTGTLSQTSTTFGQKPVGISQTSATHDKTQFGSLTGTLFNEKSQTSHGASFSSSDATKGQSGVTTQFGVKPFGSTLNTGSSFSQTQFSSTSESQKDHKSQLGVGTVSTTYPHLTPTSQYGKKPFGTPSTTFGSFQQTQHYASQKPQTTGTLSPTSTTFGQKPVGISQTSATHDKTQFGSLTGTLFNEKSQTSHGGSFSSSDATKGQSGVTTQFGVKPFGSTLNTGSSFSQTQFSSTSESLKDHKSQLGVGTVSTTFPHVTPISQYGKKPFGTQSTTFGSFQQTQHYASQKPQTPGTLSPTSTTFGQKPVGISQTSATHDKAQFGSLTGTLFNEKSQTSHGGSFSSSDATKGQSGVTTQFGVKPFGSTLNTGSSFSQTQFSSTSESQKDHNSQLGVGTVSTTFPHVTPISQYDKKPFGTQSTTFGSFQQTQHYAGQKPQTTGTLSQTSTTFGQKPVGISQTSSTHDKTQFGSLTGTLFNEKSQTSHGGSFSSSDATKGQSGVTTQFGVKPFGSTLNTGSSFSQTQFSSTSESQKDHNSQLGVGTVSTTFPHVTPISQYGKKPFGTQSTTFGSFQQTQHYASQKPQTTGTLSQTSTTFGQKSVGISQTSATHDKNQFGSTSSSLLNEKLQSTQGSSQFGRKPFGSKLNTGSSSSQTQVDSTSGSLFGQKPQATGLLSISSTTSGQKPVGVSQSSSAFEKTQFGSSSGSLYNEKSQSSSFSSKDASKGQSGLTTQFGVKPTLSTGYGFSQTQFGTASGSHDDKKSQFGFGTISTATPQVVPISQYNEKPAFQSTQNDFQQSQNSGSAGSQLGQNAQTGGSYSLFTIVRQKPTPIMVEKLQITQGSSLLSTGTPKVQSDLTNKFGSATSDSSPSTGSSSTQTHFDSTLTTQSDKKPISSQSSQDLLQGSFGGIKTSQVSKYQTSQFSTSGVQPIGSILSQVIEQQKSQTSNQVGEQNPFGGFESSYQQTGIQKPAVIQISQPFEFKAQHSNNNNLYTVSSYPSSEIHVYREQNVQGVSELSKVLTGSKTTFSKVEKKVNFQGPGEFFAGIREPPKFDIKTGYHY